MKFLPLLHVFLSFSSVLCLRVRGCVCSSFSFLFSCWLFASRCVSTSSLRLSLNLSWHHCDCGCREEPSEFNHLFPLFFVLRSWRTMVHLTSRVFVGGASPVHRPTYVKRSYGYSALLLLDDGSTLQLYILM
ncbi:uncharacterized protein LOC129312406 [Prosopis cineraria]|uniref:uncharacterized protein LOC129312406 n=1 Tax=Prosopis cineraria TaxID=364024 RepID=UPI0024108918|nr:uncharacterized protein LOC129312406 [Prosopis cineraria]